jgi:hypothetical protein
VNLKPNVLLHMEGNVQEDLVHIILGSNWHGIQIPGHRLYGMMLTLESSDHENTSQIPISNAGEPPLSLCRRNEKITHASKSRIHAIPIALL